jgi:phosphoribosylanthranilate isomerase
MGYHVRVKICGVTHPDDLAVAVEAGADAIGLNFHPASPRFVTPEAAERLLHALPPFVGPVGVFVRQTVAGLASLLARLGRLHTIQMHGGAFEAADPFPHRYVPAFQVRDAADLGSITGYLDACRLAGWLPGAVLIDGYSPDLVGGTGRAAPWEILADFRPGVPVILAGGLTPDNVAEAVRTVRPWAVDVASGVEQTPGKKDPDKVRRFIAQAREAADRAK